MPTLFGDQYLEYQNVQDAAMLASLDLLSELGKVPRDDQKVFKSLTDARLIYSKCIEAKRGLSFVSQTISTLIMQTGLSRNQTYLAHAIQLAVQALAEKRG